MGRDQSTTMWRQRMLLWLKHLRRYLVFLWKHLRLASSFDQVTAQDHQGHEEKSTRTASSLEQWQNITVCQPTHDSLNQRPLSHRPYAHILTFLKQFYLFLFLLCFCKTPCTTQYYFALYIQLFRQRLSHESVKAYATMPIGIMGSNSLALLDWVSRWFSNKEREENEYVFVLFPSTTLKNLEVHSRNCKNHHYP